MTRALRLACMLQMAAATAGHAQMRPLDPAPWHVHDTDRNLIIEAGIGSLYGHRASLAGTSGTLDELGIYGITWRTGRVALKASGTAILRMRNETQVTSPHPGVGTSHNDPGGVTIETAARLTPASAPVIWLLRFGTRLPITSLSSGLDRDQTDFFALLGLRTRGRIWGAAEAGAGINGRAGPDFGQTDVFVYNVGAGYGSDRIPVAVEAWITGHNDLHRGVVRGNEDMQELRVSVRNAGPVWLSAEWIHGLAEFSPGNGVRIMIGLDATLKSVPILGWE